MRVTCQRDKHRYISLAIRFVNARFGIQQNIKFCVDTGAPQSVMSYEQAIVLGIPLDQLKSSKNPMRVGGIEALGYFLEDSQMVFRDLGGKLHTVDVPWIIVLGPPFKGNALPVPALLGDDILRNFTLIVQSEKYGGNVIITDEKVDYTFS